VRAVPDPAGAQVGGHRLGGLLRVPEGHRVHDALVLVDGRPGRSRRAVEPEHVEMRMEPGHRIGEQGAARRVGQRFVELLVEQGELAVSGILRATLGVPAHLLEDGPQVPQLLLARVLRGERGRARLQQQPHLEQVRQGLRVEQFGRAIAGVGALDDQPVRLEPGQGLAYGGGRHVEAAGQAVDAHAGAGRDLVVHDHGLDGLVDAIGQHIVSILFQHGENHRESAAPRDGAGRRGCAPAVDCCHPNIPIALCAAPKFPIGI
jgi:hypothetical protein